MTKYLLKRLLHGLLSVIAVVAIVMLLIYSLMDRMQIFSGDPNISKKQDNILEVYHYTKWKAYGYLDFVKYEDYIAKLAKDGEIQSSERAEILQLGKKVSEDSAIVKEYVKKFTEYYESQGYTVKRLDYVKKSNQSTVLYATKDISVFVRLFKYFTELITIDNIHYVERNITDSEGNSVVLDDIGLTFTLFDPAYNTSESYYKLYSLNGETKNYIKLGSVGASLNFNANESNATQFTFDSEIESFTTIVNTTSYTLSYGTDGSSICEDKTYLYGSKKTSDGRAAIVPTINKISSSITYDENENYLLFGTFETSYLLSRQGFKLQYITEEIQTIEEKEVKVKVPHYVVLSDGNVSFTLDETQATNFYADYTEGGQNLKKVFSPAIIGRGTKNKYLLYFDDKFPFIHTNIIKINLGVSYSVHRDVDIIETMFNRQDPFYYVRQVYPTGKVAVSAYDLHTATYSHGSRTSSTASVGTKLQFVDDYTIVSTYQGNMSKTGFSFVIGIIATVVAYLLGVPIGILMARKKDKLFDKIGTIYVIFIIAVPSLAYIFMFKAIGISVFNLPGSVDAANVNLSMLVLPMISLALPMVASLMKWIRRYMIDQMNSDYVKFARSGGLSEREIFSKHILKNAIIPIVQGIPGSLISSLFGAIITERIYRVPGAGYLLTQAINKNDNSVIVGLTLYFAFFSIISLIFGDILMSVVDPRISFSEKAR